jgi:peptide/nickel transport system ATP-binding protein
MSESNGQSLVTVEDLKVYFYLREGTVRAVDGVSFAIERQKTLGVVGESGCGKSVTSEAIMQLVQKPGRIVQGTVTYWRYEGDALAEKVDVTALDPESKAMRDIRGSEIAKIFQEPMSTFSPVHTVGNQISEVLTFHRDADKDEAKERAIEMLDRVGIPKPAERFNSYPFELSGGMRQRAMIAMALSCNPSLLIADEPTTALDVTTEAKILDLIRQLQADFQMAIMFISHNLGVIAEMADDVVVMYMGKDVETAPVDDVFYHPAHPYTRDLLRSIPRVGHKHERLHTITGNVPDPYHIPPGCPYHPRCRHFMPGKCDEPVEIPLFAIGSEHTARCWLYEKNEVSDG